MTKYAPLTNKVIEEPCRLTKASLEPMIKNTAYGKHICHMEDYHGQLMATTRSGQQFAVDLDSNTVTPLAKHVFQKCTTCNTDIRACKRIIELRKVVLSFVVCQCGQYPLVMAPGLQVFRLPVQFDSSRYYEDSDHDWNRSAWSDGKRLVYCEKGTRTIVEYQWSDLEKGEFNNAKKHEVEGRVEYEAADAVLESDDKVSILTVAGTLKLQDKIVKLQGSLLSSR